MFRLSRRLAQAAEAISRHEFLDALAEVSPAAASPKHNGGLPIALAVSGGVDSMSLALMCREYLPENGTTLHALVVDHGLRSASRDEARKVKKLLQRQLKMKSQIRPIDLHNSRMTATNIETFARQLRFQALGRACKSLGSSLLLLGHHQDDQAETVLIRLVDGHTAGLAGMQKIANIPECHGLHGISSSGSYLTLETSQLPHDCGVTALERGGVQVGRPLLDFSKSRLLATCQKLEMPWFEDETNRDRTLTNRNAVRHIMDKYSLPEALGRKSLIALGVKMRRSPEERKKVVDELFDAMPLKLDLRSGVVTVEFPKINFAMLDVSDQLTLDLTGAKMLVKRVAQISYWGTRHRPGSFDNVARSIYNIQSDRAGPFHRQSGLMADSLHKTEENSGLCFDHLEGSQGEGGSMKWKIYRAPARHMKFVNGVPLPSRTFHLILPNSETQARSGASFSLWDDRYWINVHNPAKHDLWVRTLDRDSLASLRTVLSSGRVVLHRQNNAGPIEGGHKYLDALLRETAKGIIRWSLPVIVSYKTMVTTAAAAVPLKTPQILAFPTLGLRVAAVKHGFWPTWVNELNWEIRYKKIDLGNKKLEDCLVGAGQNEVELPNP